MTQKEHAVALIGHGPLSETPHYTHVRDLQWSVDYINEIIISDNNNLPFTSICRTQSGGKYSFDDLDYIIVPLYEKMYLNANVVIERIKAFVETGGIKISKNAVCRPYLTSTRSLKKHAYANKSMNTDLKNILLRVPTPQFIWCADFMLPTKDFLLTESRIIIDATAGTYEAEPWLLYHDHEHIVYFDSEADKWYRHDICVEPYEIYRNNLMEY